MPRILENRFIEEFGNRGIFSREELYDFFKQFEPDLKEGTLAWRIYDLKNKNIIRPVRRGYYIVSQKPEYKPEFSSDILKLAKYLSEKFEAVKHCIWETDWLNEFSQHQASKKLIIIEIEKDLFETLYYNLKDSFRFDFYCNPGQKAMEYYVSESTKPVIVKRLITRSPVTRQKVKSVQFFTPGLEKILVDLFADNQLFYFHQGPELIRIYENAIKSYSINYTRLFGYARRRNKEQQIRQFMTNYMEHLVKNHLP